MVIWITGLSGAGKSTIGKALYSMLSAERHDVVLLDGDQVREVFAKDLGHNQEDRLENAYRIARLARLLSSQDLIVICCTMSLFPEIWDWNRQNLSDYFQVYLRVPLEILQSRDPSGLYKRAAVGAISNVVGIDLELTEPMDSELIIDNKGNGSSAIAAAAKQIYAVWMDRN